MNPPNHLDAEFSSLVRNVFFTTTMKDTVVAITHEPVTFIDNVAVDLKSFRGQGNILGKRGNFPWPHG